MRGKRAKQIKRVMSFLGHREFDEKGRKLISQYRRFKKIYTRNQEEVLIQLNKLDKMRIKAQTLDALEKKGK